MTIALLSGLAASYTGTERCHWMQTMRREQVLHPTSGKTETQAHKTYSQAGCNRWFSVRRPAGFLSSLKIVKRNVDTQMSIIRPVGNCLANRFMKSNLHKLWRWMMTISWRLRWSSIGLIREATDWSVSPCCPAFCLPFSPSFCFLHRSKHSLLSSSLPLFSSQSLLPSSPFFLRSSSPPPPLPLLSELVSSSDPARPVGAHLNRAQLVLPLKAECHYRRCLPSVLSVRETLLLNGVCPLSPIFMASISFAFIFWIASYFFYFF